MPLETTTCLLIHQLAHQPTKPAGLHGHEFWWLTDDGHFIEHLPSSYFLGRIVESKGQQWVSEFGGGTLDTFIRWVGRVPIMSIPWYPWALLAMTPSPSRMCLPLSSASHKEKRIACDHHFLDSVSGGAPPAALRGRENGDVSRKTGRRGGWGCRACKGLRWRLP